MNQYAILANPGHNRVYFEASKTLALSELAIALTHMSCTCDNIAGESIENIYYLVFDTQAPLGEKDILVLSKLSFVYALFERETVNDKQYLRPIPFAAYQYADNNISTILKYTGKTNELFTRMMINVAVLSSGLSGERVKLLDPIAGKGTTLYEGLICGFDVYGIEVGDKAVEEAYHYMKKYLETEKWKHTAAVEKVSGPGKSFAAKRYRIDMAKSKEDMKKGDARHWEMIAGNSMYANQLLKKNTFDLIVGDLPYGVQHGSVSNQKQTSLTKNPKELVSSCAGSWHTVLKPGGVIALAWNSLILSRQELSDALIQKGFIPFEQSVYLGFEHRVDRSILRDIIVAKK